jgi:hypothetical protein
MRFVSGVHQSIRHPPRVSDGFSSRELSLPQNQSSLQSPVKRSLSWIKPISSSDPADRHCAAASRSIQITVLIGVVLIRWPNQRSSRAAARFDYRLPTTFNRL